jgi:hypothetical protein
VLAASATMAVDGDVPQLAPKSAPHFDPSNTSILQRANKDNISYGLTRSSLQGGEPILRSDAWCPAECRQEPPHSP